MTDGAGKLPSNPYIGARPFRRNERIYGRSREARDLLSLLVGDRVVLLNSPSGAGKTSLIQAALVPTLERRRFVVRPTIRVGASSPLPQANRYLLSVMQSLEDARPPAEQLPPEQLAALTLDAYLQQRASQGAENGQVLIFDQFEEVLTLDPSDEAARVAFFEQLGDALADPWRWALFAIREEYVAALEPYLHLVPTRFANTFRLELLGVEAAAEAIRGPASSRGVAFEPGVAEALAGDLAKVVVQDAEGNPVERAGTSVEPVQLQVVCYRLWERRFAEGAGQSPAPHPQPLPHKGGGEPTPPSPLVGEGGRGGGEPTPPSPLVGEGGRGGGEPTPPSPLVGEGGRGGGEPTPPSPLVGEGGRGGEGGQTISAADVQALGSIDNALEEYYESGVAKAAAAGQVGERAVRAWVDTQLITRQGFRSQVLAGNEAGFGLNEATLDGLTDAYLVREERRRGVTWLELAHDRLIAPVRASNIRWFAANLSPLQRRAEIWAAQGQPLSLLFRDSELADAEVWAAANQAGLTADERLFLENCREERKRAEERLRQALRIRNLAIGASIAAVLAALLAVTAFGFYNQANTNYVKAVTAQAEAVANGQTAVANEQKALTQQALAITNEQRAVAQQATAESNYRVSRARELVAAARNQLPIDPEVSIMLSLRAVNVTQAGDAEVSDAISTLQGAVQRARGRATFSPDGAQIFSVAYSPDDSLLATAGFNNTVHLLDASSGEQLQALSAGENRYLLGLDFRPDGAALVAGGDDQVLYAFQLPGGAPLPPSEPLGGAVVAARYSPDGALIAVALTSEEVLLLDGRSLARVGEPLPFDRAATDVAFSPDGGLLAVPAPGGVVNLWDTADGAFVGGLQQPTSNSVLAVAFSADGAYLAVGGRDQRARVWDVAGQLLLYEYRGHSDSIFKLAFGPQDAYLITASGDATIRLWNIAGESTLLTLAGHSGAVRGIDLRGDGSVLASASADTTVRQWSLGLTHGQPLRAAAFSPDGASLASAGDDGLVQIWDARGERLLRSLRGHAASVQTIAFSPDGSRLISGGADGLALLWDVFGPGEPQRLAGHSAGINRVAFSPRESLAASAGDDGTVRLWDTLRATEVYSFTTGAQRITSLAFSPDGSLLAAGDGNGYISVWQVRERSLRIELVEPEQRRIQALAFSPDGARLAVASDSAVAYLFTLGAGEPIALEGHGGPLSAIIFSHSGAQVATASSDDSVRLWDAASGAPEPLALPAIVDPRSLAFSPDDAWLAVVSTGSSATSLYPLSRQALIELAAARLTRDMARECEAYAIDGPCP